MSAVENLLMASAVLDLLSGIGIAFMGISVWRVRPRTNASIALAIFALVYSVRLWGAGLLDIQEGTLIGDRDIWQWSVVRWFGAAGALGLLAALLFHLKFRPLKHPAGAAVVSATFLAVVLGAIFDSNALGVNATPISTLATGPIEWWVFALAAMVSMVSIGIGATDGESMSILMLAYMPFLGMSAGLELTTFAQTGTEHVGPIQIILILIYLLMAGFTVYVWARRPSLALRRVMFVALISLLAGMLTAGVDSLEWRHAVYEMLLGVTRVILVLLFGIAIVRNQVLDIDVKLKSGISRSTVAAIIVAVGFMVSELAANFLSDSIGPVLGIAAAGALVFAIHPLMKFGERIAEVAMPGVRPVDEWSKDERLAFFRGLVISAWSDGELSRTEGRVLEEARTRLEIDEETAFKIEKEARLA